MKNITLELEAHLSGELTTLAMCWKITRADGTMLGFTSHDQALSVDGMVFDSIAGFTPSAVESKSDLSVDNMDVESSIFPSKITEADLLAGLYNFAEIEIFLVNYAAPDQGKMIIKRGRLGEVTLNKRMFRAEVRGLTQHLSQTIGEVYSPTCRAVLGDRRCKVNLASFTMSGVVADIINRQTFEVAELDRPSGWFTGGELIWISGANQEQRMEIKDFAGQKITLALAMGKRIEIGDRFDVVAGCDKRKTTCIRKFNNIVNFRGEPDMPGMDQLFTTAGTRNNRSV